VTVHKSPISLADLLLIFDAVWTNLENADKVRLILLT
jgi:hypothetical protein